MQSNASAAVPSSLELLVPLRQLKKMRHETSKALPRSRSLEQLCHRSPQALALNPAFCHLSQSQVGSDGLAVCSQHESHVANSQPPGRGVSQPSGGPQSSVTRWSAGRALQGWPGAAKGRELAQNPPALQTSCFFSKPPHSGASDCVSCPMRCTHQGTRHTVGTRS